jgi:hypothetical protein
MPAYRFVPGLHPHPFRKEGGHMYTDGTAPEHAPWQPDLPWEEDRIWLRGMDLFDQRFYWECHEAFEAIWHELERGSLLHTLSQGLIQASAFVLKTHVGQERGASYLLERASLKLQRVQEEAGSTVRGVDLPVLLERLSAFHEGGDWPCIGS